MTSFADLIGVGGITTLADDIVKLIPNKNAEEQAQLQIQLTQMLMQREVDAAQAATNTAQATNPNLFVSGPRPAAMWICVFGLAWQFIILQMIEYINAQFGHTLVMPVFDTSSLIALLVGMLGLGGMRSYDKLQFAKLAAISKKPVETDEDEDDK